MIWYINIIKASKCTVFQAIQPIFNVLFCDATKSNDWDSSQWFKLSWVANQLQHKYKWLVTQLGLMLNCLVTQLGVMLNWLLTQIWLALKWLETQLGLILNWLVTPLGILIKWIFTTFTLHNQTHKLTCGNYRLAFALYLNVRYVTLISTAYNSSRVSKPAWLFT